MKFQELAISKFLQHTNKAQRLGMSQNTVAEHEVFDMLLNQSQIILMSDDIMGELTEFNKTITNSQESFELTHLDIPFEPVYVEAINSDLYTLQPVKSDRKAEPVLGTFYCRDLGAKADGLMYAYRIVVHPEYQTPFLTRDALRQMDLSTIAAINQKTNGLANCSYNKKSKVTGNRLIKTIIICDRKENLQNNLERIDCKPFIYSHSFDVRGHWRKVNRVGKNPSGDYCVKGATWISSFRKGAGEYIKKSRMFI